MTREEEQSLIERVRSGDSSAFETLVLENQTKVYNLALRMTGNEEDALDMSQEAFLRAYNSLDGFRGDSRFSVWLYRLTSNICIDFIRSRKRAAAVSLHDAEDGSDIEIPDERFLPETELERREFREALSKGLTELTPEYSRILILREVNGLSYDEIGEVLELSPGTVKSRIHRARGRLISILRGYGNLFDGYPSNK